MGARLLSRLPEPPRRLHQRVARQARELGIRIEAARPLVHTPHYVPLAQRTLSDDVKNLLADDRQ